VLVPAIAAQVDAQVVGPTHHHLDGPAVLDFLTGADDVVRGAVRPHGELLLVPQEAAHLVKRGDGVGIDGRFRGRRLRLGRPRPGSWAERQGARRPDRHRHQQMRSHVDPPGKARPEDEHDAERSL